MLYDRCVYEKNSLIKICAHDTITLSIAFGLACCIFSAGKIEKAWFN